MDVFLPSCPRGNALQVSCGFGFQANQQILHPQLCGESESEGLTQAFMRDVDCGNIDGFPGATPGVYPFEIDADLGVVVDVDQDVVPGPAGGEVDGKGVGARVRHLRWVFEVLLGDTQSLAEVDRVGWIHFVLIHDRANIDAKFSPDAA